MTVGGMGGRSELVQPVRRPGPTGGGGESKTFSLAERVVAAVDSPAVMKENAHYVCDGVNDEVEIQAALDEVEAMSIIDGEAVVLTSGTFNLANPITLRRRNMLWGQGPSTVITHPASFGPFWVNVVTPSGVDRPVLRDLTVKGSSPTGGGVNVEADDAVVERVWFENNELLLDGFAQVVRLCRFVNARLRTTGSGRYGRRIERCVWDVSTTFVDPVVLKIEGAASSGITLALMQRGTGAPEVAVAGYRNTVDGMVTAGKLARVSVDQIASDGLVCTLTGSAAEANRVTVGTSTEVAAGGAHLIGSAIVADDMGYGAGSHGALVHDLLVLTSEALEVPQSWMLGGRGSTMTMGSRVKPATPTAVHIRPPSNGAVVAHNDLRTTAFSVSVLDQGTGSILSTDTNIT